MVMNRKPTVIDLFAGAGLFSYAFAKEGFDVIWAVELDSVAAQTYVRNIGPYLYNGDIKKTEPSQKCDVLIAGPPCQGFSTLGKRNPRDPRNSLSLEVVRWTEVADPSVVVIENVGAFLKTPVWKKVVRRLDKLGYHVSGQILKAYDYGVPQIRNRSFTIASKRGVPQIKRTTRHPIRTVREAWRGLPTKPNSHNFHHAPEPSQLALARMQVIPLGGDKRDVMKIAPKLAPPSWWKLGEQATDVWGRMAWDRPCNTLRTCLQNPSKGRYIHPEQNRVISLREAARLHTIPDTWTFEGTPTQIARQIGNSVPPYLGRAVARAVRKLFEN